MLWSKPKQVSTAKGDMLCKTAPATSAFWRTWERFKDSMAKAGFNPVELRTGWVVNWWERGDGEFALPDFSDKTMWIKVSEKPPPHNKSLLCKNGPQLWFGAYEPNGQWVYIPDMTKAPIAKEYSIL